MVILNIKKELFIETAYGHYNDPIFIECHLCVPYIRKKRRIGSWKSFFNYHAHTSRTKPYDIHFAFTCFWWRQLYQIDFPVEKSQKIKK